MLKTHFKAHQLGKIIIDTRRKRKKGNFFRNKFSDASIYKSGFVFFLFKRVYL